MVGKPQSFEFRSCVAGMSSALLGSAKIIRGATGVANHSSFGFSAAEAPISAGQRTSFGVTGTVTFDGKPVEEGRIQFREFGGEQRSFSGSIENGAYAVETATGAMRVEVRASRLIPGKFDESNPGEKEPMGEMYIHEKYNSCSELTSDVPAGGSAIDFTLTSS